MIKLVNLLKEVLTEVSIEQLKTQFVDPGKISQNDFDKIKTVSNNQGAYATWLVKRVIDKIIKNEDIYKYKNYFTIFNKYKNKFIYKDINQYKTKQDIQNFIKTSTEISDAISQSTGNTEPQAVSNLVPLKGIEELKSVGISLIGIIDGYQCFKIPQELGGNKEAWKIYKKWLAKCSNRKEGEGIGICTMADYGYFDQYLETGPLYVFFNLKDSASPYQFHYEENQFMNKNDIDIVSQPASYKFFKFLEDKDKKRIPATVKISNDPNYKIITSDDLIDSNGVLDFGEQSIPSLPNGLEVEGDANFRTSDLKTLPNNLKIKGNLILVDATMLESLPNGLEVEGTIQAEYSGVKSIPNNIKVNGNLWLHETPISKQYTKEQLKQMLPGVKGDIYM
jgi:hypothetical protein